MLDAAIPSDACSSLTGRKTKTKLGSQCGPGGRKREKEDGGRTPCILREEEVKDRWKNQSSPPICIISLCKMGTAIVLPLCWGKKIQECGALFPWEKGHEGGLASLAPSHISISCSRIWPTCVSAHHPEQLGTLPGILMREEQRQ